jgi:feruloyl esterase
MQGNQHWMSGLPHRRFAGRRSLVTGLGSLALLAGVVPAAAASQPTAPAGSPGANCNAVYLQTGLHLAHVTVSSAVFDTSGSYTPPGSPAPITALPDFCAVSLTQTDQAGNQIHIAEWLPVNWNGRFQGIGGGGYSCGITYASLGTEGSLQEAVDNGYAGASTDCGVPPADALTGKWGLNANGSLNTPLIHDFVYDGMHDMTVAGKEVTQLYYRAPLKDSYFYGCSTGGREGLEEAQMFPADYNGIVSGAPAINWTQFIPSELWPELVMLRSNDALPSCKETAFTSAALAACADGSGVIENPAACHFNPHSLVGDVTPCGTITAADAAVMEKIWDGPLVDGNHLWYGLEQGASLFGLAGTSMANGTTSPAPFPITVAWLQLYIQQDPSFNWQTLTYQQFVQYFEQSVSKFPVFATDNADLSAFERDGGKILIWHGLADQLIFPQGTIRYYQQVEQALGAEKTATFARLFIAPGAQHCTAAAGPAPADPLSAVVNWVEDGQAPSTILATAGVNPATSQQTQRDLCGYPYLSEYVSGNPDSLGSYRCVRLNRAQQRQLTALD